ncbi:hypothetical protein ACIGW0_29620 [Streptomyces bikiniensis]|uniref:Uncharacterized protein n=1 Tax=Streptomyces bikiniensis TaxID=1896 RepID=A0ABW8D0W5_STRBI
MTSAVGEERGPASPAPNDAMSDGVVQHTMLFDRAPEEPSVAPFDAIRGGDGP